MSGVGPTSRRRVLGGEAVDRFNVFELFTNAHCPLSFASVSFRRTPTTRHLRDGHGTQTTPEPGHPDSTKNRPGNHVRPYRRRQPLRADQPDGDAPGRRLLWNKKMMIQITCRGYATAQFMQARAGQVRARAERRGQNLHAA